MIQRAKKNKKIKSARKNSDQGISRFLYTFTFFVLIRQPFLFAGLITVCITSLRNLRNKHVILLFQYMVSFLFG